MASDVLYFRFARVARVISVPFISRRLERDDFGLNRFGIPESARF
jgi:hypothetical protein